jgi:hypothetical protein
VIVRIHLNGLRVEEKGLINHTEVFTNVPLHFISLEVGRFLMDYSITECAAILGISKPKFDLSHY